MFAINAPSHSVVNIPLHPPSMNQDRLRRILSRVTDVALQDVAGFKLSVPYGDANIAARLLIAYLKSKFSGERSSQWNAKMEQQFVRCRIDWEKEPYELLGGINHWELGCTDGDGVVKSVIHIAVQLMANDERLTKRHGHYRTLQSRGLQEPLEEHKTELRVLGFLCLLCSLLTGLGPEPISYSVLWVALMDGHQELPFDEAFLAEVDSANIAFIRSWQGWDGRKASIMTEADGGSGEFMGLAAYIDASGVETKFLPDVTKGDDLAILKRTVLTHFLFGDSGRLSPEFNAFASGFNYRFDAGVKFSDFLDGASSEELLLFLYNRRVEEAADVHCVLALLKFPCEKARIDSTVWTWAHGVLKERLVGAFEAHLTRYLVGTGHPNHASIRGQIVDEDRFVRDQGDRTLRVRLLLLALTGVDLLPSDPGFKIKFVFRSYPDAKSLRRGPELLDFLSCSDGPANLQEIIQKERSRAQSSPPLDLRDDGDYDDVPSVSDNDIVLRERLQSQQLEFHTCHTEVIVHLRRHLRSLLMPLALTLIDNQPPMNFGTTGQDEATDFDAWIHMQLFDDANIYTMS